MSYSYLLVKYADGKFVLLGLYNMLYYASRQNLSTVYRRVVFSLGFLETNLLWASTVDIKNKSAAIRNVIFLRSSNWLIFQERQTFKLF